MREIKFRVYIPKRKEIHLVIWIMFKDGKLTVTNTEYDSCEFKWRNDEWFILMQYTWLKDKNGKEIYEGDVVYIAWYGNYEGVFPFIELYNASNEDDIGNIIGNIYENPELLNNDGK